MRGLSPRRLFHFFLVSSFLVLLSFCVSSPNLVDSLKFVNLHNTVVPESAAQEQTKKAFQTVSVELAKEKGCLSCHDGIEDIREKTSLMMLMIKGIGQSNGDPGGCVVCHGGTPMPQL